MAVIKTRYATSAKMVLLFHLNFLRNMRPLRLDRLTQLHMIGILVLRKAVFQKRPLAINRYR